MLPDFRKNIAVWKVRTLGPFVILIGEHADEDEYGALVEWYWQGELKYWERNIIQRW
jgi:hypothetical protein